jgi:hypothetical protein
MFFIIIIFLVLVLGIIGGIIYSLSFKNKKMTTKDKTPGDRNSETVDKIINKSSEEKSNPAFHLFLYLVSFLSLGFMVFGILVSFFQAINKFIPDSLLDSNLGGNYFDNDVMKFGLSALIVTIPIYYGVLFLLNKKLERMDILADSPVRKVITYLALVAFSAMAIGSLVTLLYTYFDGELTTRFVLKTIAFFVVSVFFFSFYFWEVRRAMFHDDKFNKLFAVSLLLAIGALVLGFFVIDSPKVAREKRQDNTTIQHIRNAVRIVTSEYSGEDKFDVNNNYGSQNREKIALEMAKNGSSPAEIEAFVEKFYPLKEAEEKQLPKPEDVAYKIDKSVTYKPLDDGTFELCADFKREATEDGERWDTNRDKWSHPKGNYCFIFDADSASYDMFPIKAR